jgi:acyl carrier protein
MVEENLENRVRALVAEYTGVPMEEIKLETDIVNDLRIYGDDVWELVYEFSKKFNVEMHEFRWYHHSGPEGCNPLWLFFQPWWTKKTHIPIRLFDLVESAKRGAWVVQYPEDERQI